MGLIHDFYRRDAKKWSMTFTDKDDNPINITNSTVTFTMKVNPDDDDSLAVIQKNATLTDPTNGVARFELTGGVGGDTDVTPREYYYDIIIFDPSNQPTTVDNSKLQ